MACVRGLILLSDGARLLILFVNTTAINGQSPEGSRRHSANNCPIGQVSLPNVDDGIMAWYSAGHPRFYKIVLAPDCSAPFIPAACILVSRPQLRPRLRSGCSRTALVRELPFFYCGGEHVLVPVFLLREVRPSVFRASLATTAVGNFRSPGAKSFAASGGRADGGRFDCRRRRDPRSKHFAADHGSKSSAGFNSKAVRRSAALRGAAMRAMQSALRQFGDRIYTVQPSNGPQSRSVRGRDANPSR